MKVKSILIIILAIFLLELQSVFVCIYAQVHQDNILELSLEQAVEICIENDTEIKRINNDIRDAKELRKDYVRLRSSSIDMLDGNDLKASSNYVNLFMNKYGYYVKMTDNSINLLNLNKRNQITKDRINVVSLYYSAIVAEMTVQQNQVSLAKAENDMKNANQSYIKNDISEVDLMESKIEYETAKKTYDVSVYALDMAKLEIINKIGIPLSTEIILTDNAITYEPITEDDLNLAIEKALSDTNTVLTAIDNYNLQEIQTRAYNAYYTSNLPICKSMVNKLNIAEEKIEIAKKDVELDIRKRFKSVLENERDYLIAEDKMKVKEKEYEEKQILLSRNEIDQVQLTEAQTDLINAEINKIKSLVDYTKSKIKFEASNHE